MRAPTPLYYPQTLCSARLVSHLPVETLDLFIPEGAALMGWRLVRTTIKLHTQPRWYLRRYMFEAWTYGQGGIGDHKTSAWFSRARIVHCSLRVPIPSKVFIGEHFKQFIHRWAQNYSFSDRTLKILCQMYDSLYAWLLCFEVESSAPMRYVGDVRSSCFSKKFNLPIIFL